MASVGSRLRIGLYIGVLYVGMQRPQLGLGLSVRTVACLRSERAHEYVGPGGGRAHEVHETSSRFLGGK